MGFREILRVDSPVSNIIYVPHVRPPRLPWRKCRDIFVRQHMTRRKKKGPQCDPCHTLYVKTTRQFITKIGIVLAQVTLEFT